jgi:signal transduction histidine kinase
MVDGDVVTADDGHVRSRAELALAFVAVVSAAAATALAGSVGGPASIDSWTDGAAGARLWMLVAIVPVVMIGLVTAAGRRGDGGRRLVIGTAAAVAAATMFGEAMHVDDPTIGRRLLGAIGAGLDVTAVLMAVGTLLRQRSARHVGSLAVAAGVATGVSFGLLESPSASPRSLHAVSTLQVPSLGFYEASGETVLLALTLTPVVAAAGMLAWLLIGASIDDRHRLRWLALCLVTGLGAVAVVQAVRLLGLLEMSDGFLAAFPRAVAWTAVVAGAATTVVQPEVGNAATAARRVAVGIGLVSILSAAGGLAWFAADATTAPRVPFAPALAMAVTIAALFVPVRERLEFVVDRWFFGEVGSDARLIDSFGAAAEHAGRTDLLELLVVTARRALRLRWARASTSGLTPVVAVAGLGPDQSPDPAANFSMIEGGEWLGLLECGAKRGGPLSSHDRQLLGALSREAALRLRSLSQADELEERLRQIEHQAAEIAASRARIVEAQDEERRRIERNIHDGVQQDLASLTGKLRLAINQIAVSPETATATIAGAQDDVRRTLADVRAIAQGIHPAILDDQGIVRAIDARAKRLPFEVSVEADPSLTVRRFERQVEGAAYFVASEALANVVKHADATAVTVELTADDDRLTIRVSDDGRGLGDDIVRGSGLTNMADRAAALNGALTIEANPAGGTIVVVELPLSRTVAT